MNPRSRSRGVISGVWPWVLISMAVALAPALALGQEAGGPSDPAKDDDLMRPTRNGFRLTPEIVQLFSRQYVEKEVNKDLGLSNEQIEKLSKRFGERTMDMGHRHGEPMRDLIEYWMETLVTTRGQKISPEMVQELGRRGANFTPGLLDLFKGFADDARGELSEEQWGKYRKGLEEAKKDFDHLEQTLQRWSRGELKPGEDTLNGLEQEIDAKEGEAAREPPVMRRVKWQADYELNQIDPKRWRNYLTAAKEFFKFDAQQMVQGEELLAKYSAEAQSLMAGEWRERCRQNRMRYSMRWQISQENTRPWVFHLEREFEELAGPIKEVQTRFQAAVIALATTEQREAAAAPIRERADKHGMPFDDMDLAALGLGGRP